MYIRILFYKKKIFAFLKGEGKSRATSIVKLSALWIKKLRGQRVS